MALASYSTVKDLLRILIGTGFDGEDFFCNTVADKSMRSVGYCFWDWEIADRIAMDLTIKLAELGYDNVVIRTSVWSREYIRLRVIYDSK